MPGGSWAFLCTNMRGTCQAKISYTYRGIVQESGGENQAVPCSRTTAWPEDKGVPDHWNCSAAESGVLIPSWLTDTATAPTKPITWGLWYRGSVQHSATQYPMVTAPLQPGAPGHRQNPEHQARTIGCAPKDKPFLKPFLQLPLLLASFFGIS